MGLYRSYLRILVKSQLQYRSSFFLLLFGQTAIPLFVFVGIVMLFSRFGSLGGWSREEVFLCYGVTHMAFALATCFARGFDQFSSQVMSGEFDRVLVRPRGTVIQTLGARLDLSRFGRLIQGAAVLAWAIAGLDLSWDAARVITLAAMLASGSLIFAGIYILGAALCFRTIQGLELVNILTDGGRETAQYPLSIYPQNLLRFFSFVVPFACFNYLPLLWILGKPGGDALVGMLSPWLGMLFLVPCLLLWRLGVRKYLSTGS